MIFAPAISTRRAKAVDTAVETDYMKIALIVHDLHEHGGHSLYTKILADQLSRNHDVAVFANRCEQRNGARWQSRHVRAWRSTALACVQTFPIGMRSHASALADYQIQHAQGHCGGKPNVVTAHICVAAYLNSLRKISAVNRASLRLMAAAEARFYRRYDGQVIAISKKIASELRELYDVRGSVTVIPHGVDSGRFAGCQTAIGGNAVRAQLNIKEDETIALYVGDLTKAHVHLKALAAIAPEVQFVIVTGSRRYVWQASNVRLVPPTKQLEAYYAAADAFVFPTTYDSFGMVVLEAMASGLPVFTSGQAGAAELITHGADGFVLSLDEWVEKTAEGLKDRAQLSDVGRAAAQTARRHNWDSVVSTVERVYEHVLSR